MQLHSAADQKKWWINSEIKQKHIRTRKIMVKPQILCTLGRNGLEIVWSSKKHKQWSVIQVINLWWNKAHCEQGVGGGHSHSVTRMQQWWSDQLQKNRAAVKAVVRSWKYGFTNVVWDKKRGDSMRYNVRGLAMKFLFWLCFWSWILYQI